MLFGAAIRVIVVWSTSVFALFISSSDYRFLSIEGMFSALSIDCIITVVYAPNVRALRNGLWEVLSYSFLNMTKPWCLLGDFNEVLHPDERSGATAFTVGMRNLRCSVDSGNLIEYPLLGRSLSSSGLSKGLSDHCPILLSFADVNWRPRPFRVLDCWWLKKDFGNVVADFWRVSSSSSHNIASALRSVSDFEKEIDSLELIKETRPLTHSELSRGRSLREQLVKQHRKEESLWKSWIQWCKLGDKSTSFFHLSTSIRGSGNKINSISIDGRIISQLKEVNYAVRDHFHRLYSVDDSVALACPGLRFKRISSSAAEQLESFFDFEEIRAAVWDCESSNSPGPDGLDFFFIKKHGIFLGQM
ncbi:uncharacterized protein LOC116210968 [Punica granatum]|uniref:Uncharacterized protein LOC116210968 n=1 Tax=Punica granatum TaxID=22663 RepID=A0A6P8E7D8_PUNGR|nr:uncharacterized protein LOC116210968 [Punica granatum]